MVVLMAFVQKTKPGQAMRAVSEDRGAAQLMGINVNGTIALTFAIGSGLAAVAGVLLLFHVSESHTVYRSNAGNQSVCCSSIWWNRIDPGAFIGGILLGLIEIFSKAYY